VKITLQQPPRGFTLIELLVVIVVISISFATMLLNISFGSIEDDIKQELKRLQQLSSFTQHQAIIQSQEYGIYFTSQGYEFLALNTLEGRWLPLGKDKILRPRLLPSPLQLELFTEDVDVELEDERPKPKKDETEARLLPHVFLFSSGEVYPEFSVQIRVPGETTKLSLLGTQLGEFSLHNEDDE